MSDNLIHCENLSKRFGKLVVLDGMNFTLREGETYGLLGVNGVGKSVFLETLWGMFPADSGTVSFFGEDPWRRPERVRARAGYFPEDPGYLPQMTVRETMEMVRAFISFKWDAALADELMRRFELNPDQKVSVLSRGTLAKLTLLLAVAHRPEVLLLDEPSAGLDPLVRDTVLEAVLEATGSEESAAVITSHVVHDIERLADRVGIIHQGRLELEETVEAIRTGWTLAVLPPETDVAPLAEKLSAFGSYDLPGGRALLTKSPLDEVGRALNAMSHTPLEVKGLNVEQWFVAVHRCWKTATADLIESL